MSDKYEEAIRVLDDWCATGKVGEPPTAVTFDATMDEVEDALELAVETLRAQQGRENPKPLTNRERATQTGKCYMCEDCPDGCPVETPQDSRNAITNADRMRSMTDEEVVDFVVLSPAFEFEVCACCEYGNTVPDDRGICLAKHGYCSAEARARATKVWLRQPAKEDA